jgi:hypothetical protein
LDRFPITRLTKGRLREYDIQPQVREFKVVGDATIPLSRLHESGKDSLKPLELLQAVFGISEDEVLRVRVVKIGSEDVS